MKHQTTRARCSWSRIAAVSLIAATTLVNAAAIKPEYRALQARTTHLNEAGHHTTTPKHTSSSSPAHVTTTSAAHPPAQPVKAAVSATDLLVLNFANVLEKLETTMYQKALEKFALEDWVHAGFSHAQAQIIRESFGVIASDEDSHSVALEATIKALGGSVVSPCQFNLNAVLSDPLVFLATAQAVEVAGISAYQGGATLISDKSILSAALSIHAIEARHQTQLNILNAAKFVPQAFDMSLTPPQVLALAGGFLDGCKAEDLGLTANLPVSIRNLHTGDTSFEAGSQLAFVSDLKISENDLFCQMMVGDQPQAVVQPLTSCKVPPHIEGPVYVFLTSDDKPLSGDINVQDGAAIKAGPGIIFVENTVDTLQNAFAISPAGQHVQQPIAIIENVQHKGAVAVKHVKLAGADLGAVAVLSSKSKASGNPAQFWSQNKIAVHAKHGVGVLVIGWA